MKTQSRFDEAAAQWDNNAARVELARAVGEAIARVVPLDPRWRAVDYGAGTGLLTLNLQARVGFVAALDTSAGMLNQLKQKLEISGLSNIQPRSWNLEDSPYPETDFDLATCSMAMHHVRNVPLVLGRLGALLKPGAWLAVADLEKEDGSFHGPSDDVFHQGFERKQFVDWFTQAGFENVETRKVHELTKPSAITGELRPYAVFLASGRRRSA